MIKTSSSTLHLKAIFNSVESILGKRIHLSICLLLLLPTLSSCTSYEIKAVADESQWAVFQNDYLIPEYTTNERNEYPSSQVEAESIFVSRKDRIEDLVRMKYEKLNPWQNKLIVLVPVFVLSDIFYTAVVGGANICRTIGGKDKYDFVWFPASRWTLHGSPLNMPNTMPPVRDAWLSNLKAQKELEIFLADTSW